MDNKAVFERIFNKNFNDSSNAKLLEAIANEHPYFSAAQFFLLQQTTAGTDDFSKQAVRTAILFNDPHWLNFQLQQTNRQPVMEELSNDQNNTTNLPIAPGGQPAIAVPENNDNDDDSSVIENNSPMTFELKLPVEKPGDESLTFEPMHLVDYFASQGIKLSEQEPTDKLGKQLKSFTEWLKTMKKLPGQAPQDADAGQSATATEPSVEQADLNVQALAEKSNQEEEVLTEAMAHVLASQGKRGKAIELYQKLSLMNPSKSAYFAAKIEQLKES